MHLMWSRSAEDFPSCSSHSWVRIDYFVHIAMFTFRLDNIRQHFGLIHLDIDAFMVEYEVRDVQAVVTPAKYI